MNEGKPSPIKALAELDQSLSVIADCLPKLHVGMLREYVSLGLTRDEGLRLVQIYILSQGTAPVHITKIQ